VSGFLLDTNVISELVRPRPDSRVVKWIDSTAESLLYLSVLTLGEIRTGITSLVDGRRRVSLESWLDHDFTIRFSDRILPIDSAVADRWGRISANAKAKGSPMPVIDGLLAATAMHFDLTVVSRDKTFHEIPSLEVFNPWLP
jgi:predicted nucleic acid-binding protein